MPPGAGDGPHVFVADLERPVLEAGDRHHLERVLRVRTGDAMTASDGLGRWRRCRFGPELEVVGEPATDPRPEPVLTVAFALVKGGRPELVVQKLTELGMDRIVVFAAARSVVRWDERKAASQVERLRSIAREAAMQCRRTWLPTVDGVATYAEVAELPGAVRGDRGGEPPTLEHPTVLIGPEGGWTDEERAALPTAVALGDHVLRAETASFASATLLAALRAGLVAPAPPPAR